jgi:hypothetical protein
MADRPRNCWCCGIPGHSQRDCRKKAMIQAAKDPAAVRKKLADEWVQRGNSLQPKGNGGAGVNAIVLTPATPAALPAGSDFPPLPLPATANGIIINATLPNAPPLPPRPERLGGDGASIATVTAAPVVHEGMDLDRPIEIAMSGLLLNAKRNTRASSK